VITASLCGIDYERRPAQRRVSINTGHVIDSNRDKYRRKL
jgi:hypothetical protein